MALLKSAKPTPPDGQMELMEHLAELRTRIFRTILYIVVGMVLTYNLFPQIYGLLSFPLRPVMEKTGGQLIFPDITSAFLLRLQVCFVSGIAAALPFVTMELWGFIEPALTPEERRPVKFLAPFSVLLFLAGLATGYASLPMAYAWMSSYIIDVPGATLMQQAQQYIVLTVKIILAFGISFQLPLILLFLARIGLITADLMTTYWRHATVGIAVAAAILTPSNDPLTMLMMAVPMAGLYLLSIGLVRAFEPKADGTRRVSFGPMLLVALAPIAILIAVGFWLSRTLPSISRIPQRPSGVTAPKAAAEGQTTIPAPNAADVEELRREVNALQQRLQAVEARGTVPSPPR